MLVILSNVNSMLNPAGVPRLEHGPTVLETGMLPLHYTPIFVGSLRFELRLLVYQTNSLNRLADDLIKFLLFLLRGRKESNLRLWIFSPTRHKSC